MEVKIAGEEVHQGDQGAFRGLLGLKPSVLHQVRTWEEVEEHRQGRGRVQEEVSWVPLELRGGEEGSSFVLLVVLNREIHDH